MVSGKLFAQRAVTIWYYASHSQYRSHGQAVMHTQPKKINNFWQCVYLPYPLGMATGRVRAGFFHTRTRPAGQDPWPGPAPFRVPGFFPGPRPAPAGPRGPRLEIGPNLWPNQKKKKKKKPRFIFSYVQACIFKFNPR